MTKTVGSKKRLIVFTRMRQIWIDTISKESACRNTLLKMTWGWCKKKS